MKLIKKEYVVKDFILNKETINKIEITKNRRQIKERMVRKLHGVLIKGGNPIKTLMVNEKNNMYRLIDGNHRIEALKRFYAYKQENQKKSFECELRIYKNLPIEEENKNYSEEADRVNQTHEDLLCVYKDEITFWKITQDKLNEFPCIVSIYPSVKSLKFRTILDSLATVMSEQNNGYVPRYLGKKELIDFAKNLRYENLLDVAKFIRVFQKTFGEVGKGNSFTRSQGFLPLFDIYFKNFRHEKENIISEKFSRIVGKSDIMMYLNMNGREAQQKIRELMVGYLNKGKKQGKNLII